MSVDLNSNAFDVPPTSGINENRAPDGASLLDAPPPTVMPYHNGKSADPKPEHVAPRTARVDSKGREIKGESTMPENPEHMSAAERLLDRKQRDLEALEAATVRDLARMFTAEAMETLVDVMQNPRAASPARVSAAAIVIERGAGKPLNYFSPLREDISKMSAADAFAAVLQAANAGEVSFEEVKVLTSLLEARSKGIEVEELAKRLADLEAQLEMASPSTSRTSDAAKMN